MNTEVKTAWGHIDTLAEVLLNIQDDPFQPQKLTADELNALWHIVGYVQKTTGYAEAHEANYA